MKPVAALLALLLLGGSPAPALAYLKFGVRIGASTVDVKWNRPVPYFVTERGTAEVTATQLRDAVARAFATWQAVPTAEVRSAFQGFTIAPPGAQDERTTFGFLDRPDLDRVLGATSFLLDATTGEIREAEVFFNTRFTWTVATNGEGGRDLESIALHEIGHLLGLGHSAIGETEILPGGRRVIGSGAVMFPIALSAGTTADRALQADDAAAISDLYPAASVAESTSSISGRVLKGNGGVFGAHVVALHLATGALVGGFALNAAGDFVIARLSPGVYVLRVEPLDDADGDSFFAASPDIDFRVAYAPRVVIAPAGGGSDRVDISVVSK